MRHVPRRISTGLMTGIPLLFILIACSPQDSHDAAMPVAQPVVMPVMTRPVPDELVNMGYSGIQDDVVTLSGGTGRANPMRQVQRRARWSGW